MTHEEQGNGRDVSEAQADTVEQAAPAGPINWSPIPDVGEGDRSWVISLWRRICREPALMFSTAYVLVAFLGLWSSVWFYRGFGIAILDYLQASDYLVAGLRDPIYVLLLASGVMLAILVSWPEVLRRRHPEYVADLRRRRWWARAVFSQMKFMTWTGVGIHPVTGISVVVAYFMLMGAGAYMQTKGELLREKGRGRPIRVQMLGDAAPLPGEARLLGTSSAFVYLWWPAQQRAEAVPVTSVRLLQTVPPKPKPSVAPKSGESSAATPPAVH